MEEDKTSSTVKTPGLPVRPDGLEARPLYFAYGSNLAASQMRQRCIESQSSIPVALARLDGWRWIICSRGYANVIPPPELRVGLLESEWASPPTETISDSETQTVYGLLYRLSPEDEIRLDGYEDVDYEAAEGQGKVSRAIRPREQGRGDYTKWYVPAKIEQWLGEDPAQENHRTDCPVLVYLDEECVRVGAPKDEYVERMNRAIGEAELLGLPEDWVNKVMRQFVPI